MRITYLLLSALLIASFAARAEADKSTHERIFGLCEGVPAGLAYQGIPYSLGPLGRALDYFKLYEGQRIALPPTAQVSVVVAPKHGKFIVDPAMSATDYADYSYLADVGYLGEDSLTLKINLGEVSVTLVYFFHIRNVGDNEPASLCNKTGDHWKIS